VQVEVKWKCDIDVETVNPLAQDSVYGNGTYAFMTVSVTVTHFVLHV
jgi:hypothetical protein